jgi:hypothetical protein
VEAGTAIHVAARRYCLERYSLWAQRYAEIVRRGGDRERDGYHYTLEALATFPRYNFLNAIRVELERIDPSELRDIESAKAWVVGAGETANDEFTRKPIGAIEQRAIAEERAAFRDYIRGLSPGDVIAVEPLPFRRVLTGDQSEAIWSRLRERWQIGGDYWYPLTDCALPCVVAFDSHAFGEAVPLDRLRSILARRGEERIWELREYGPEYEQDLSLLEPWYNGAEGYWSSGSLDWILYASHENSVTAGGWLLEEITALWTTWQAHSWTGLSF